jgi:hypothetical protein
MKQGTRDRGSLRLLLWRVEVPEAEADTVADGEEAESFGLRFGSHTDDRFVAERGRGCLALCHSSWSACHTREPVCIHEDAEQDEVVQNDEAASDWEEG